MIPNKSGIVKETALSLIAQLDQLPIFLESVRQMAESAGLDQAQHSRLELVIEEAWVNICHHAYADQASGMVRCRVVVGIDGLWMEIADEGPAFNPLTQIDPDTGLALDQRKPGGLGILLIKSLVNEIAYRREDGWNVLTLGMLATCRE